MQDAVQHRAERRRVHGRLQGPQDMRQENVRHSRAPHPQNGSRKVVCTLQFVYTVRGVVSVLNLIMGWLQLVGSLKIYVSFAEYRLFYRALLQKRPIILRSLLIVATP